MAHRQATLEQACYMPGRFPLPGLPEVAFVGRSNVGKSSLLNALARAKVAHVSNSPGKTRSVTFFRARPEPEFFLVDLPGYGYAKRGHDERRRWNALVESYLKKRESLVVLLQLVDFRHGFLENDLQFQEWVAHFNVPVQVVFTKADKIARSKRRSMLLSYCFDGMHSISMPLLTSSDSKDGVEELDTFICSQIEAWKSARILGPREDEA